MSTFGIQHYSSEYFVNRLATAIHQPQQGFFVSKLRQIIHN